MLENWDGCKKSALMGRPVHPDAQECYDALAAEEGDVDDNLEALCERQEAMNVIMMPDALRRDEDADPIDDDLRDESDTEVVTDAEGAHDDEIEVGEEEDDEK